VTSADGLADLLRCALSRAGEPQAQIHARLARRGFARFSGSELGQHMAIEEPRAVVRVARGSRVAEVATTRLDEAELVAAVHEAAELAPSIPEDPVFPGFAGANEPSPPRVARWASSTAQADAESRVTRLAPVLGSIARAGLEATGFLDTTHSIEAIATSGGLCRAHAGTLATFKVWALEGGGSGGASGHGLCADVDVDRLDLAAETERAIEDALRGRAPSALEPGAYDVVLEPLAVAELIEWLGFIALGARELAQGTSALSGRLGERISGESLTVHEDPLGELSFAAPFDAEGVARRRVTLIERGVARGVLADRAWAKRLGIDSTGSAGASSAFAEAGPMPAALVVAGGQADSVDELVGALERGLRVRRLHYVNGMLEPRRAVMTGLTRDGTFLVEGGRVTRPVGNLRFTDSLLEAFERVEGMTRGRKVVPNWWSDSGSCAAPAILVRGLKFTGASRGG
jgi:predicted Zn-dependent protease